jgi:hypothetical protein
MPVTVPEIRGTSDLSGVPYRRLEALPIGNSTIAWSGSARLSNRSFLVESGRADVDGSSYAQG